MAHLFAFGTDRFDPSHRFVTSWLVSPFVLCGVRALVFLYTFTTLIFIISYQCANEDQGGCTATRQSFSFFTVLTYWGIALYNLTAAIHTLLYALNGSAPLHRFPRPLQALHAFFSTTVTTYPYLVTIVFWSILASPKTLATSYSAWDNISQHMLNSVFATVEIVLSRTNPPPFIHLVFLLVILILYLALAYITRATEGFYTYDFLDPGKQGPLVAAYVFGVAIGICVLFVLSRGLVWLRRWVTETKLGYEGVFAPGDVDGVRGFWEDGADKGHELVDVATV
ncbi:hypothetical protein GGS21DRAFT_271677 [Xylaria nigripes]|nr:hypothetical protein GGS21DRAFT_271677 [Xylaria nigripes]